MENTADVKEDNTTIKTDLSKENGHDQSLLSTAKETNVSTAVNDDVISLLDCKTDDESKTKATAVCDVNGNSKPGSVETSNSDSVEGCNSVSVENNNSVTVEHDLNVAIASITISDTAKVKQNQDEVILNEQHKQETITTNNENSIIECTNNTNSEHEYADKILETDKLNSTVGGEFDDTCDYVDEYYDDTKQTDDLNECDRVDDESCDEEEQLDNEDDIAVGEVRRNILLIYCFCIF